MRSRAATHVQHALTGMRPSMPVAPLIIPFKLPRCQPYFQLPSPWEPYTAIDMPVVPQAMTTSGSSCAALRAQARGSCWVCNQVHQQHSSPIPWSLYHPAYGTTRSTWRCHHGMHLQQQQYVYTAGVTCKSDVLPGNMCTYNNSVWSPHRHSCRRLDCTDGALKDPAASMPIP
jgi:hypothetical protein